MTPEEIEKEIEMLNRTLKGIADWGNDVWEEKDRLRQEYKKLTGMDI